MLQYHRITQKHLTTNGAPVCTQDDLDRLTREMREKEQKAIEKALDAVIEVYGPALKELEKH